ncbi:hypothetical protein EV138_4884 [Kribbella voronezhensis]|uniref:Uncharacterized protein n=1 Tax=Kribbella voronezhensis TaxID=2512212 RepID=A0A4R7TG95_9ACTN|nr:hypothetical protein [Kribbella voronezhensis]TDU91281.1 hypothetical protein EV138_4884 [Kribbella voronezhensis]
MGTTGLIYVAIVAAWAAYLVPMLLKRGDEVNRRRTAEKYSSSDARVLARNNDVQSRSKYVVRPAGAVGTSGSSGAVGSSGALGSSGSAGSSGSGSGSGSSASGGSGSHAEPVGTDSSPPARYVPNRARRVAAMRRRRVLSILTLSLLSMTALAGLEILLWWTVAIPATLIVAFVVLTRVQLRRQARERAALIAERRARAQAHHDCGPASAPSSSPDHEMTVEVKLPIAEPAEPVVTAPEPAAEGLWDPVPVTLPTYVMKEKAPAPTVRTISLSGPEVFSSARTADPDPEAAPVVPEPAAPIEEEPEIRRAVGD